MNVEWITAELLKAAFEAWQREAPPPVEILTLRLIQQLGSGQEDLSREAYQLLRALVAEQLGLYRQMAGLPPIIPYTAADVLAGLRQDFAAAQQTNIKPLKYWSALYYRFVLEDITNLKSMARKAHCDVRVLRRYWWYGLEALAQIVRELERGQYVSAAYETSPRSSPEYLHLWGVEPLIRDIMQRLLDPAGPPFISIEGLSGIGKTVLTQEIARRLSRREDITGVLWVSARQEHFTENNQVEPLPYSASSAVDIVARLARQVNLAEIVGLGPERTLQRLEKLFETGRYIVLLDNLDTIRDVGRLLSLLATYAGTARYLLTSRASLRFVPYVHVLKVAELSYESSQALVQQELDLGGRAATLSDSSMETIYETVGGLPLALKFVARRMIRFPLQRVLEELREAPGTNTAPLYEYLYRQAWRQLDKPAQTLLQAAVSTPTADLIGLRQASQLPEVPFDLALNQLLDCSLLQVEGSLENPLYQAHRLTYTFIHSGIHQSWRAG